MQLVAGCRHSVGIAFVVRPVHFLIVHGFPAFHEFVHLLMNFEAALSLTLQVLKYFFHLSSPSFLRQRFLLDNRVIALLYLASSSPHASPCGALLHKLLSSAKELVLHCCLP